MIFLRLPRGLPGTASPVWAALVLARLLTLGYAWVVLARSFSSWDRPLLGVGVLCGLSVWTFVVAGLDLRFPTSFRLSCADLLVAVSAVLLSAPVQGPVLSAGDVVTLPSIWVATVAAAWAFRFGVPGGVFAAMVLSAADFLERGSFAGETLRGAVMLLVLGGALGYLAVLLARQAGFERRVRSLELESVAAAERERLVRLVHDSTLQDLAVLASRSAPAEAVLARGAELRLRNLLASPVAASEGDLLVRLRSLLGGSGELSATAESVVLPPVVLSEVVAAVEEAFRNVSRHAPAARIWVFVDVSDGLLVSVRDDGPGFAPGRLEEAEVAGRLGVSSSIRGRMESLGGSASVSSSSAGVEVELCLPAARLAVLSAPSSVSVSSSGGS